MSINTSKDTLRETRENKEERSSSRDGLPWGPVEDSTDQEGFGNPSQDPEPALGTLA
jgi:hypothetical protein